MKQLVPVLLRDAQQLGDRLERELGGDVLHEFALTAAKAALAATAVVKLNGGLATSMGLRSPKSLIEARAGRSFLDIIIGNTLALRRRYGVRLPLVLMNSQATREDTTRALESHPDLDTGLPVHFLQSMEPKLDAESLAPVSWAREPSLEWCPPGHGDVYSSLRSSGMLDALLNDGFRYAMIANADNLGATPDARIDGLAVDDQRQLEHALVLVELLLEPAQVDPQAVRVVEAPAAIVTE